MTQWYCNVIIAVIVIVNVTVIVMPYVFYVFSFFTKKDYFPISHHLDFVLRAFINYDEI